MPEIKEKGFPVRSILLSVFLLGCILGTALCFPCRMDAGEVTSQPTVLVIHSYHKGFQWTDILGETIISSIREKMPQADFVVEYMDTLRYYGPGYLFDLALIFRQKYGEMDFDLIICTDDEALKLIRYYGASLFPEVPVVFTSINDHSLTRKISGQDFTGIIKETPVKETVDLALSIHPDTETLLLLCDSSRICKENVQKFLSLGDHLPQQVKVVTLSNLTFQELRENLKTLPEKTTVLIIRFWKDSSGDIILPEELAGAFFKERKFPLYTSFRPLIAYEGFLGGVALSPEDLGNETGRLALSILQGEEPASIPVTRYSPGIALNYETITDLGIPADRIPKSAEMVNRPRNFWEKNRDFILLNILVAGMVMIFVTYLLANIHRRRRAEKELIREKEFMEQLFQNSPEGIVLLDNEDRVLRINREMCRMFKCHMETAVGVPINDLVAGGEMASEASELSSRALKGESLEVETLRKRSDGTFFPVSLL
ncbi:MAG: PAS domain S-box protein, partial [Synergistales bacterium]|nr:PAS domain S-box protein [Synergistales bacterium]